MFQQKKFQLKGRIMDKFFGYFGLFCFVVMYVLLSIKFFVYDGNVDTYILCVMIGNVFLWFDYKMNLTHVTRHIVHYEDKEQ